MWNLLKAELLKLRRCQILWVGLVALALCPLVQYGSQLIVEAEYRNPNYDFSTLFENVGHAHRFLAGFQNFVQVTKHRHLTVLAGLSRVFQRGVIMSDAFCVIGTNKGFVQKLSFLVRHIGDQQTEKYVELLDLCCKFR